MYVTNYILNIPPTQVYVAYVIIMTLQMSRQHDKYKICIIPKFPISIHIFHCQSRSYRGKC